MRSRVIEDAKGLGVTLWRIMNERNRGIGMSQWPAQMHGQRTPVNRTVLLRFSINNYYRSIDLSIEVERDELSDTYWKVQIRTYMIVRDEFMKAQSN